MKTIRVLNINIGLDLLCYDDFKSAHKYEVDGSPDIIIVSRKEDIYIPKTEPKIKTKYYLLFDHEGYTYQLVQLDNKLLGSIHYKGDEVIITMPNPCLETEYLLSQYALTYILDLHGNSLLMHGSSLMYKNKGIIFSAKSGTGKSTHSRLWQKYSDSIVVNDDKNIVALEDDKLFLYPSPWSGKHMLDNNLKSSLDAVVFLYQSPVNEFKEISKVNALRMLLTQIERPTKENLDRWNKIVDKLLELPIYYYGCNMEKEAFDIINKKMEEDLCL